MIAVAVITAFVVFKPKRNSALPAPLAGVWTTANPRYAGRSLELTRGTVAFGTGEQTVQVYFISDIKKTREDDGMLYEIHCHRKEGPDEKIFLVHTPQNGGQLRFKNQRHIVWEKNAPHD